MPESHEHDLDDIDRLFLGGLDRAAVPDDFTARVLASTVARQTVRARQTVFAWPWIVIGVLAFGLLTLAGYQLGVLIASSDGVDLLSAVFLDAGLLASAPGDVLAALAEVIPWWLVGLAAVSAALLIVATGHAVSRDGSAVRPPAYS